MKFDHLGIIVRDLQTGREQLARLFSISTWTGEFHDSVNRVSVQFGIDSAGPCYEVIAPFGEGNPVSNWLRTGKNIVNHVAYLVDDLDAESARLRSLGCVPSGEPNPAIAYGNRRIQFFVTPLRFIVELIEAPDHEHIYIR